MARKSFDVFRPAQNIQGEHSCGIRLFNLLLQLIHVFGQLAHLLPNVSLVGPHILVKIICFGFVGSLEGTTFGGADMSPPCCAGDGPAPPLCGVLPCPLFGNDEGTAPFTGVPLEFCCPGAAMVRVA